MGAALAELCLLGNKIQHSQVGYIGYRCGRLFSQETLKASISLAKVREKLPANVQKRKWSVARVRV